MTKDNNSAEIDIALDAELWAEAGTWAVHEVDYLAVGLDPIKVREIVPDVGLDLKDGERRRIRERIDLVLRGDNNQRSFSPVEFLQIAKKAAVELPIELRKAVLAATANGDVRRRSEDARPSNADAPSRLKYNKLLRMFFAVGVEQYGFDPTKPRQDAVNNIVSDARRMGIKLDDQTVRSRLKEAHSDLDELELEGLKSYLQSSRKLS